MYIPKEHEHVLIVSTLAFEYNLLRLNIHLYIDFIDFLPSLFLKCEARFTRRYFLSKSASY
jgi:hypothetical protein